MSDFKPRYVRYTVIIERELGESDGQEYGYHDGTGQDAAIQLADELQRVWGSGAIAGNFRVVRRLLEQPHERALEDLPTLFEDDPQGDEPEVEVEGIETVLMEVDTEAGTVTYLPPDLLDR